MSTKRELKLNNEPLDIQIEKSIKAYEEDKERRENERFANFLNEIRTFIPKKRIYTDELRRLAWGADAGFYRLTPRIVIIADNEEEISRLLPLTDKYNLYITFRAAGTSLSGQAISDSILIVIGRNWNKYSISPDHERITLQPGIIGQRVNELLAPYGRKFSPDPASIKSATVGGIVMNNASGMNCGIHANSDRMLVSARIVLMDGTILDTGDPESRRLFQKTHFTILNLLTVIRGSIILNSELTKRIRHKYSIKNVTGLNLLPFLLYEDPFDIIAHLMVGSEGTLAFLSEVTMKTEYDYPCKASAMLYFKSIEEACRAVLVMKKLTANGSPIVYGAELLDWKSLNATGDQVFIQYQEELYDNGSEGQETGMTAILAETKSRTPEELKQNISAIESALASFSTYKPIHFTDNPEEYSKYWDVRSGIFPAVGRDRPIGTTSIIEDVAFHIEDLPEAILDLQQLLTRHGYHDACIYGHALEGNCHFIISQSFEKKEEVERYANLMEDLKTLVIDKYDGSLKAEHGTGRNMAPFVKYEWGDEAYKIMQMIKDMFDPLGILNPDVIFRLNDRCHLRNLKPMPLIPPSISGDEEITVNHCIECGFCEASCVSCGLTLSPRQRIVIQREIAQLEQSGCDPLLLALLKKQYKYMGDQTCARDGLCYFSCPMKVDVSELTHHIRCSRIKDGSCKHKTYVWAGFHFATVKNGVRHILKLADFGHSVLGTKAMGCITKGMHKVFGVPQWHPAMPKAYRFTGQSEPESICRHITDDKPKVVYFPSCINQTMGLAKKSPVDQPLVNKMISLLHKAGYEVIFPKNMEELCCGAIWENKGMPFIGDNKLEELEIALLEASENGKYPVLCDQSPCLYRLKANELQMDLYEPAGFIYTHLKDRLVFTPTDRSVAVHVTCSTRKLGAADTIVALARLCSNNVIVPEEVGCCGFAGDRGFTHPELNAYALRNLRPQIEAADVHIGYSNSRTCEIGLTTHSGIPYVSIVYLVDECTKPRTDK